MSKKRNKKSVVVRRNAGLGDNLLATAHAWYYASQTGRDLEICWAPSMYFKEKTINSFGRFFEVPREIGGVKIQYEEFVKPWKRLHRRLPLFPLKLFIPSLLGETAHKILRDQTPLFIKHWMEKRRQWLTRFIESGGRARAGKVVINTHFNFLEPDKIKPFFDALRLAPKYQERLDDFRDKHFKGKKVIGVHIRYYDKSLPYSNHSPYWMKPEERFNHIKSELRKIIKQLNTKDYVVFLATDNEKVHDFFKTNIDHLVTYEKTFHDLSFTLELHQKTAENAFEDDLIEMFLLAESSILYRYPPSGSWFSYYGSLYASEVVI